MRTLHQLWLGLGWDQVRFTARVRVSDIAVVLLCVP